MTRKENLLHEIFRLKDELHAIDSSCEPANLTDGFYTPAFRLAAANTTVTALEDRISELQASIARAKKNQLVEVYYATDEGKARKAALQAQLAKADHDIAVFLTESSDFYRKWIKEFLGGHWTLSFLHGSRLEFAVVDPQNEGRLVFGQTIQIWFERRNWKGEERFETNIGSTGGFDILAAGQGDRARFYIDLGRFLADTQRMAELKEMLFDYKDSVDTLYKTRDGIEKELNEPELS